MSPVDESPHFGSADKGYKYLDDQVTADVTFAAWGRSLEELFASAADATVNVMIGSLDSIRTCVRRSIVVEAGELDMLLLRFLNELVFLKDAESLILRVAAVRVEKRLAKGYCVQAELVGEEIDRARHELVGDVKAVTLAGLRIEPTATGWRAQVTLDV